MYFADVRRKTHPSMFFELPGLGAFAPPTSAFSGAWAYPRKLLRELTQRPEWRHVIESASAEGGAVTAAGAAAELHSGDERASAAMGFVGCSARAWALQAQAAPVAAAKVAAEAAPAGPRAYPALNLSALTATGACSVLTARPWDLRVYHLSRSGPYYTRTPSTST